MALPFDRTGFQQGLVAGQSMVVGDKATLLMLNLVRIISVLYQSGRSPALILLVERVADFKTGTIFLDLTNHTHLSRLEQSHYPSSQDHLPTYR